MTFIKDNQIEDGTICEPIKSNIALKSLLFSGIILYLTYLNNQFEIEAIQLVLMVQRQFVITSIQIQA